MLIVLILLSTKSYGTKWIEIKVSFSYYYLLFFHLSDGYKRLTQNGLQESENNE